MAGNATKSSKSTGATAKAKAAPAAVKAAPSEAKPAAKPVAAAPAAKTAAPVAKTAAPAPKPAEAKPVEAKPSAPAKVEAKPVEKAPARPAAHLTFGSNWKQTVEGELVGGGTLALSYDPARAQLVHKKGDKPAWGVQAFVKLVPSGQVVEQPAVDFNGASAKARPVTVEIPRGTTEIQVWFKNWAATDKPGEAWDSNFGLNYKFAVRP